MHPIQLAASVHAVALTPAAFLSLPGEAQPANNKALIATAATKDFLNMGLTLHQLRYGFSMLKWIKKYAAMAAGLMCVVLIGFTAQSAQGFGSVNAIGQHGEHESVTALGLMLDLDMDWGTNSLNLLKGTSGHLGGVGAPDNPTDWGQGLSKGLGPGMKHCDDGDYFATPGYKQSEQKATATLQECAEYFQFLMKRAVIYAGDAVTPNLVIDKSLFRITDGNYAQFGSCGWEFSLVRDKGGVKCDVMNAVGRALHLAEDVWAHTNWGDYADPSKPLSITNPPGLGKTDVPPFLRYPVTAVTIPAGLISGCDDTAGGTEDCTGRVTHTTLNKDKGEISSLTQMTPTKQGRTAVVVNGKSNFAWAVTGAANTANQVWRDFEAAVIAKYGKARGDLINKALMTDKAFTASAVLVDGKQASGVNSAGAVEVAAESSQPSQTVWWITSVLAALFLVGLILAGVITAARNRKNS